MMLYTTFAWRNEEPLMITQFSHGAVQSGYQSFGTDRGNKQESSIHLYNAITHSKRYLPTRFSQSTKYVPSCFGLLTDFRILDQRNAQATTNNNEMKGVSDKDNRRFLGYLLLITCKTLENRRFKKQREYRSILKGGFRDPA